ncbi:MAG: sigma-54-dependent Fis family transcriptional regulator, partial [Planctomycetota bacterium]
QLMQSLQRGVSREDMVQSTLPSLLRMIGADAGGLVSQVRGNWTPQLWFGDQQSLPESIVSDVVDEHATRIEGAWCVSPLNQSADGVASHRAAQTARSPSALVLRMTTSQQKAIQESVKRADQLKRSAELMALALQRIDTQDRLVRRVDQLSTVLAEAAKWQTLDDDEALLRAIADTACQLLGCQRASIFLWAKRRGKLIGRPALGIEGESLEVDDNAGVVGEVLQSGEPKIWSAGSDSENRINRSVDQAVGFETRSLLAVPMVGGRGDLIGVFEVLNHRTGEFSADDATLLDDLATHAAAAIDNLQTKRTLLASRDRLVEDAASATQLIGEHPSVQSVRQSATKVAGTDLTVLILGKNGTGKEVLARHIHYESQRRGGPFIAVNCAALVETLLESELFGHEKGAFTDAQQSRAGKFELANGGTLFLDEVGDMSPGGQAKLLRVLEEKVVVRVGGSATIPVDVRVIAATNQPLEQLINERRFREDLFFRLNVVSLTLPPLAQRGEDVLLLAEHFLTQFAYQTGRQEPTLSVDAKQALLAYPWPGNIRELRNTMERVCYLSVSDVISAEDLMLSSSPAARVSGGESIGTAVLDPLLSEATKQFQVQHIERAIAACSGNMTEAASRLGLHRSNLYRKMRQLGMNTSE